MFLVKIVENLYMKKEMIRYCPDCKTGRLILVKDENGKDFYKCENCSYTNHVILSVDMGMICPKCGDYLMIKIGRGQQGRFASCHRITCDYRKVVRKHAVAPDNKK